MEEETDESIFFMELLYHFNPEIPEFPGLIKEGNELLAITVASIKTSRTTTQIVSPNRKSSFVIRK